MKPTPKWSSKVYDYKKRKPVEYDMLDIDVQFGWWIHCRCCGRKQRMYHAFNPDAWNNHKLSLSHQRALTPIELSDSDNDKDRSVQQVCSQPTKIRARKSSAKRKYKVKPYKKRQTNHKLPVEYADFAAAMVQAIENDTDYLVFYRSELDRRVKEEHCTKDLIRGVSLLVVEQQEDVEELRDQVDSLTRTVQILQEDIQRMRTAVSQSNCGQLELNSSKTFPPLEVAVEMYPPNDMQIKQEVEANEFVTGNEADNDDSLDMFDNQIHLMQLD